MKKILGSILLLLGLLAERSPVCAEPPANREELLRLVPADYAFCVIIQDLAGHVERWELSEVAKKLRQSPLLTAWLKDPAVAALQKSRKELEEVLGITSKELLDDLFSDEIVFGYRHRAAAKSEEEDGLILLRAKKPPTLTKVMDQVNGWQRKSGELKQLEMREHGGVKYLRRVDNQQTVYYLIEGPFFALSGQEATLRSVIDKTRAQPADPSSPVAVSLNKANADKALAAVYINPRAFDEELKAKAADDLDPEALVLRSLQVYWKGLEGVVLSLEARESLELRLVLQARTQDLPPAVRKAFDQPTKPSKLWSYFPEEALAIVAGREDLTELADTWRELLPAEARRQAVGTAQRVVGNALGLDLIKDVVPNIGPDWGACVLPPEQDHFMPRIVAAIPVKAGEKNVNQALFNGIHFAAFAAVVKHNATEKESLTLASLKQGDVEVKYLKGDKVLPPGVQPAFALKDGFLVLASAPSAIAEFRQGAGKMPAGDDVPLVRVSARNLAKVLRDRAAYKTFFGEHHVDGVSTLLDLFDHLTLSQRSGNGQVAWMLRVR